jgi:phage terminase large subunit
VAKFEFPEKFEPLFEPHPYKVYHGGRGAAKSWNFARALLILGRKLKLRILCAREFQKSIADSVHKLLADQIALMQFERAYTVQERTIYGPNGTEFLFVGLYRNVDNIRSVEGVDIAWVTEAKNVSRSSWNTFEPTIRKDPPFGPFGQGSEIWIDFNPELETDETYVRFVLHPPPSAKVVKVNWRDNPWFPARLREQMETAKARSHDDWLNVWEGHCRQTLDGAIYASEIREATEQDRITAVPYHPRHPVQTFWDLGRADLTSIWFAQIVGFQYRVIDYYENSAKVIGHYLKELQSRPYVYGTHWMPHDADSEQLGNEKTIKQQAEEVLKDVQIVPQIGIANGINAARTIFPNCWFDREKCADGLQGLRHYQFKVDDATGQRSKEPLHNWASHPADAFRYLAVAITEPVTEVRRDFVPPIGRASRGQGWMAR